MRRSSAACTAASERASRALRRLVEKQQAGIAQDGAGDGNSPALAARQADPPFADRRVIAVFETGDELVRLGLPRGGDDPCLARLGPAEADIVANACREQRRFLRDKADETANVGKGETAQILAAKHHPPASRVVEAQQQMEQDRFAGPTGPDEGHALAAPRLEIDAADGRTAHPGRVGEISGFEPAGDVGVAAKQRRGRRFGKAVGGLQGPGNTLGGAGGALQLAPASSDRKPVEAATRKAVEDEGRQIARRNAAGKKVLPADPENGGNAGENEEDDDAAHPAAKPGTGQRRPQAVVDGRLEPPRHHALTAEGLNRADGGDRFLGLNGDIGQPVPGQARGTPQAPAKKNQRTTTSGGGTSTTSDIFGLESATMTRPPTRRMRLRAAIEMVEVITVRTIAVSAVMRAGASPVRAASYQEGGSAIRWAKTARRTSARTLSPIRFTSVVRR